MTNANVQNCDNVERIYTLENKFLSVGISNFGACIQYIRLKRANGYTDVCLGFASSDERLKSGTYCGAYIGRVANRIAGASFELNGVRYALSNNEGNNTLHGGVGGFDRRYFQVATEGDRLTMRYVSPDGEEGFPATLTTAVTFWLEQSALCVEFSAISDGDTVWAPTMHPYFTLGATDVSQTYLQINASEYTPMVEQIPTGEIATVRNTPLDFTKPKQIVGEFDHNFVLNDCHAATAVNSESGVQLDIYTDLPGLQFYSGKYLNGFNGQRDYRPYDGFALEPQYYPNAVNISHFPQPVVKVGETKTHYIKYVIKSTNN